MGATRLLLNLANTSVLVLDWSKPEECVHMVFNESYGDIVSAEWMLGVFVLVGFATGVVVIASLDGGACGVGRRPPACGAPTALANRRLGVAQFPAL